MADKTLYTLTEALARFATSIQTQDQRHIQPLHWYIAAALVVEGGFPPRAHHPNLAVSGRVAASRRRDSQPSDL